MEINKSTYKKPASKIPKEDNKNEFFRIITKSESDKKNYYEIMDTLEVTHGKFNEENSLESMLLIVNEWDRFCKHNKIDCGKIYIVKHKFERNDYDSFYPVCSGLKEEDDPEELNLIKFDEWLEERNIRLAIEVSNNSRLTQITFNKILEKLDNEEKADFLRWLQLVETKQLSFRNKINQNRHIRKIT